MSSNTVLTYPCLYYRLYDSFQLAHLSPHSVDCSDQRIEEIPGGSSCFPFFSDDIYFARLPEDEHLMVLPVMLKSLRMSGVWECHFGARLPEDSEVLQMRRWFAGFREGDSIESSLIYTSRYFSRSERAGILVESPFRKAKCILELSQENVFALVSRTLNSTILLVKKSSLTFRLCVENLLWMSGYVRWSVLLTVCVSRGSTDLPACSSTVSMTTCVAQYGNPKLWVSWVRWFLTVSSGAFACGFQTQSAWRCPQLRLKAARDTFLVWRTPWRTTR